MAVAAPATTIACDACGLLFPSEELLAKHKSRFCTGSDFDKALIERRRQQYEESSLAPDALASFLAGGAAPKALASAAKDVGGFPFLASLAEREEMVRNGKLTTIIFIRDKNHKGQEVSGYIDYAHRLKTEHFEPYFERKKKLMPKPSDLSFYNWETQTSTSNATPNFQVIADSEAGLLFKNKRDRKVINVDPKARPGDNSRRIELQTHEYTQVVLYDHVTRRKT